DFGQISHNSVCQESIPVTKNPPALALGPGKRLGPLFLQRGSTPLKSLVESIFSLCSYFCVIMLIWTGNGRIALQLVKGPPFQLRGYLLGRACCVPKNFALSSSPPYFGCNAVPTSMGRSDSMTSAPSSMALI